MIYPEPEKGGRGKVGASKEPKKFGEFSGELLRMARFVLKASPDLAGAVARPACAN